MPHNTYYLISSYASQCQNPFVGTGRLCTIDSDSDQYPDNAIESEEACNQTGINGPKYCINDTCPDVYNTNQSPQFCITTGCMSTLCNHWSFRLI